MLGLSGRCQRQAAGQAQQPRQHGWAVASVRSRRCAAAQLRTRAAAAAAPSTSSSSQVPDPASGRKVVVVGGGWAGFGAAKHLAEQGYAVTLLDASPNPGGLSAGWRTKEGRAVEAGVKGFWYQYHNIFSLVRELGIPWPFTDFETSGFWGADGELITQAPVFSKLPRLPAFVGQFVHTFNLFDKLPLQDRATVLPWLYAAIDLNSTLDSYDRYDQQTAREVLRNFGVSQKAYDNFLKPTMLVGLFAPPEELSAAVAIETLYFYALAHQADFDVCWCKGSVSDKIFLPLVERIKAAGGSVQGGRLVTGLVMGEGNDSDRVAAVVAKSQGGGEEVYEADAVIFAISISGMQKLVCATPELADRTEFRNIMNLKTVDCIATRLWFDRRLPTRFPANVLAGFEPDTGGTFFNLNDLQDEYRSDPSVGSVIAADFYHAPTLLPLSDEEIVHKVHTNVATCEPAFREAKVVDSAVLRFPRAVTHFSPGSHQYRPRQRTSLSNGYMAGDWVKGVDHGANGLSQERAYVTGLTAANLVIDQLGVGQPANILPVEADEPHIALAKTLNRQLKTTAAELGVRLPPYL